MIISKNIIYKGWSTLYKFTLKHFISEDNFVPITREIYDSGDGVSALLYNIEKKTVILIRQFRLAAFVNGHPTGMILETCAGMLDDLDPETAIKKEILEETGFEIKELIPLQYVYATPGAHMEKVMLYLAEYNEYMKVSKGGGVSAEHEDIEVLEFSFEKIKEMLLNKEIEDAKTLILLQHAMLNNIIV